MIDYEAKARAWLDGFEWLMSPGAPLKTLTALLATVAEEARREEREAAAAICLATRPGRASESEKLVAEVVTEECAARIRARGNAEGVT